MNGKDMGYAFEMYGLWRNNPCPQWVKGEQFYNCENFTSMLMRSGFSLDRLFHRSRNAD